MQFANCYSYTHTRAPVADNGRYCVCVCVHGEIYRRTYLRYCRTVTLYSGVTTMDAERATIQVSLPSRLLQFIKQILNEVNTKYLV